MVAVSLKKKNFFQAEDGIRDRSPSRGLGDVYKRQGMEAAFESYREGAAGASGGKVGGGCGCN